MTSLPVGRASRMSSRHPIVMGSAQPPARHDSGDKRRRTMLQPIVNENEASSYVSRDKVGFLHS